MIKDVEKLVLSSLEHNPKARENDFILYGSVLKRIGIDLKNTSLYDFLSTANGKYPTFESVSRCRRHIQELRQDLKDSKTAIAREEMQEIYKEYNRTYLGE